ncbi:hypothetical protein K439DRAFT_1620613 [Ramaria rubella]|nr:hypothetical protein K439DRAFT_1620613 [Ramaria rubella]
MLGFEDIQGARVVLNDRRWLGYIRKDGRFTLSGPSPYSEECISQLRVDVSTAEPHTSIHAYVPGTPLSRAPPVSSVCHFVSLTMRGPGCSRPSVVLCCGKVKHPVTQLIPLNEPLQLISLTYSSMPKHLKRTRSSAHIEDSSDSDKESGDTTTVTTSTTVDLRPAK